jgi:hypothetical protein
MSLETPDKIRSLQRKLYCKSKAEPPSASICREDILRHAYALACANAGAPGVDGLTFEQIDALGSEAWLAGLREDLVSKTYRPDPVRRATIPEAGRRRTPARHCARLRGSEQSRRASSRPADGGAGGQAQSLARRLRAGGGQIDAEPVRTVARDAHEVPQDRA